MNPRQFEEYVCEYFRKRGYKAELTSYTGDCGVDVFAAKGKEKLAIQAKMYGS
jgi:restriction system protein